MGIIRNAHHHHHHATSIIIIIKEEASTKVTHATKHHTGSQSKSSNGIKFFCLLMLQLCCGELIIFSHFLSCFGNPLLFASTTRRVTYGNCSTSITIFCWYCGVLFSHVSSALGIPWYQPQEELCAQ